MEPQTIQQTVQAVQHTAQTGDTLIPVIAAFFLAFTTFIKVLTEINKIKRDRLKTKDERDKRFNAIENKIGIQHEDAQENPEDGKAE